MKSSILPIAILCCTYSSLHAQATPAATVSTPAYNPGPALPMIDGNFQYALTASEIIQFGYSGSTGRSYLTSLSGDVEYLSKSRVRPFSLLYAGGLLYSTFAAQGVSTFQSLSASQGLVMGRWAMGVSDSVSYLPQTPTIGLSGIPGVGDVGLQPTPDPLAPAQSLITNYNRRISNTLTGNVERELTGRTSISGTGSYGILTFLDGNGLSSRQISGQASINHRLDRRSGINMGANYSTFSYTNNSSSFNTRGLSFGYNRQLKKDLSLDASAGPEWVNSFVADPALTGNSTPIAVPSRLTFAANVGLSYTHGHTNSSVGYSRGVNSGSGLQVGGVTDSVAAQLQHNWGRSWSAGVTSSWSRTSGLAVYGATDAVSAGTQISRRFGQNFSGYASYSAIHQSIASTLTNPNAFSGLSQSIGVGITFAPRSARLGQF